MIRNAIARKPSQVVLVRLFSNQPQPAHSSAASETPDPEWANAQPYESIPGPGSIQMLRNFAPGGRYYNLTMPDMMQALRDDYGDLYRLPGTFGRHDMVATFKPDDFETILRTEGQWPIRRGLDSLAYYRQKVRPDVFKGMGLVTEQGEEWQHFRTIANPVMLQPKTVQLYVDKLDEVAQDFMKIIPNLRDAKNEMPADFNQWINRWALEMMGVLALDTRLGVLEADQPAEAKEMIRLIREFLELSYQLDILPSVWKYYKTPTFNRLITVLDGITDIIKAKVDAAVTRLEKNPSKSSEAMSVLEKLLKVDRDVAVIMAFDMLQAGVDTTSSGTISILHALATNPEKQNKLREEIRAILPDKNSPLTPENMRNLPYLRACIKEGLRLQSPVVGNVRTAGKDLVLQGYRIPKGTDLLMPAMNLYKDERYYARAQEFLPERWLKESESEQVPNAKSAHPFLFLPFGFGPRTCIGRRLAMMEMEIFLARVTRQFEYRWNHGPLKIITSLINVPANELRFEMKEVVDWAIRFRSAQAQVIEDDSSTNNFVEEWVKADPYEKIPGPKLWTMLRGFAPGGRYYNATLPEMHRRLRADYGDLIKLPAAFGRPDILMSYSADDYQTLFRTEGHWPVRQALDSFVYYRKVMRPHVFKMGGLVSEQGEDWQQLRSVVNPVLMQPKTVKQYIEKVNAVTMDLVKIMQGIRDAKNELPADFNMWLNRWALETIGVIALDTRFGVLNESRSPETEKMVDLLRELFVLIYKLDIEPSLWKLYKTPNFKRMVKIMDELTDIVMKKVDQAIQRLGQNPTTENLSVLEKLLKVNRDVAVVMAVDMLMAGVDTHDVTRWPTVPYDWDTGHRPDGIPNVAVMAAIREFPEMFRSSLQRYVTQQVLPDTWKRQILVLLPKLGSLLETHRRTGRFVYSTQRSQANEEKKAPLLRGGHSGHEESLQQHQLDSDCVVAHPNEGHGTIAVGPCEMLSKRAIKYLGVVIDDRLSFTTHVDYVCKRAAMATAALTRMMSNSSAIRSINRSILSSVTTSILQYGVAAWRQALGRQCNLQRLTSVQRTSSATVGILHSLATNPEKQQKLREELRTILPRKDSPLTVDNMRNLPYLRACIKEGMRIAPPTVGNARNAGQDIVLQGYQVPKGTNVVMAAMTLNIDDRHHPRAKEYLPERWLKEEGYPSVKDAHPFVFLPFGFGPRTCIGRRLAQMEMEIVVARITRQFEYRWNYGPLRIKGAIVNVPENELKFEMVENQVLGTILNQFLSVESAKMLRSLIRINSYGGEVARPSVITSSPLALKRFQSAQAQTATATDHHHDQDPEWNQALPYEKIPGPTGFTMLRQFLPGGRYHNASLPDLHRFFRKDYGDLVRMPGVLGRPDVVISFRPADYEKLFRTEGQWPNRRGLDSFIHYREKVRPDVFKGYGGLLSEQGEKWQHFRTIVNPVMLQPKTIKLYVDKVDEVAQDFMKVMETLRDSKNEMPADFHQWLNRWALETMGVLALDTRLGVLERNASQDAEQMIKNIRALFELTYELDVLPSVWKYWKTPTFNRLMQVLDDITKVIMEKVDEAVIRMDKNPSAISDDQSVLEKLLKVNRDVAVMMAYDMLLAGVDTTSSGTVGVLYSLATNPDKQAKLRDELRTILPNKNSPLTPENMRNLPYLRACIKEGLRVNPAIAGTMRAAGKDLVLQGYQIPKGTDVAMASMILTHEEEHYARAKEFIPERWLKEDADVPSGKNAHPFLFLPFGFGSRTCIGRRLALMEMEIVVSRITRQYEYRWNYGPLRIRGAIVNIPENEMKFEMVEVKD
ncbi:uncharacterized protein LOC129741117 [Uranotaenia lowii]|uniref:uncharacterized protein LOC129741117 n=1 Tax=Uranotaenia lowii TaxID=190385 RepID=UPI0024795CBA|nr:uncharacterized protein LOC129741117 [Uranotaenia lowii]